MTNKEKSGIIAREVKSRKGRIRLAAAFSIPIGGNGVVVCDSCALRHGDCEKIRAADVVSTIGMFCQVPEGKVYVYDEVAL